jgi:hypothetical protein
MEALPYFISRKYQKSIRKVGWQRKTSEKFSQRKLRASHAENILLVGRKYMLQLHTMKVL